MSIAILHYDWFYRAVTIDLEYRRSLPLSHLVVRMSREHNWYAYALMGTVDRRGYRGQQKGTICDVRGPYPSI